MLEKTQGIVLHTVKHTDSGIIAHIYTRDYGRLSFIIKGIHNKRSKTRSVYFQPLQILNIEMYYKDKRNLQSIKEVNPAHNFKNIQVDLFRNSLTLFIGEVLSKSLRESPADKNLYEYLVNSILFLDNNKGSISNFHIGFMVGLAKYLGIVPTSGFSNSTSVFDMQSGKYTGNIPLHGYYMEKDFAYLLNLFLNSTIEDCDRILLTGKIRKELLNSLLIFYSLHLPGLKNINSLEIFSEVFN